VKLRRLTVIIYDTIRYDTRCYFNVRSKSKTDMNLVVSLEIRDLEIVVKTIEVNIQSFIKQVISDAVTITMIMQLL